MQPKLWVLQHHPNETLGTIANSLTRAEVSYVATFAGEPVPITMDGVAGLIVMGGPMGVYEQDQFPYLSDEMRLIEQALKANKPVLGVCLGSQLLASVLGAKVSKGPRKEIGWYPITLTEAAATDTLWQDITSPLIAYHWHGDVFELPHDATLLACSDLTAHQAYRYGNNAYGLLFHMEVTLEIVHNMVGGFGDELREEAIDGSTIIAATEQNLPSLSKIGSIVFDRWANQLESNS